MRQAAENRFNREETLGKCFGCLVSSGLENTSIRNFSLATGLNSSSLYYWFRDKDEIVLEATLFGLKSIIDDLFTQAYGYLNDLDTLFVRIPRAIDAYKKHFKLVYQVLVSPKYGARLKDATSELSAAYDSYGMVLADRLNCDYDILCPFVHLFISAATNYVLWEDEAIAEKQYKEIYQGINIIVIHNKQHGGNENGAEQHA